MIITWAAPPPLDHLLIIGNPMHASAWPHETTKSNEKQMGLFAGTFKLVSFQLLGTPRTNRYKHITAKPKDTGDNQAGLSAVFLGTPRAGLGIGIQKPNQVLTE